MARKELKLRVQCDRVVRAPDLKFGDPEFKSRSDPVVGAGFGTGSLWFNSSSALLHCRENPNWSVSCQLALLACSVNLYFRPTM